MFYVTSITGTLVIGSARYSGSTDPLYLGILPSPVELLPPTAYGIDGDLCSVGREWNLRKRDDASYSQGEAYRFEIQKVDHASAPDGIRSVAPFPDVAFERRWPPRIYVRKGLGADPLDDNALIVNDITLQVLATGHEPTENPEPSRTIWCSYRYSDVGNNEYRARFSVFDGMQVWLQPDETGEW